MASEQTTPSTGSGTQKRQRKKSHPYSEQLEKFVSVVQKKSILLSIENRRSRVSNMDVYGALWHYAGAKMPKERLQKHALSRRLAAQVRVRNTRQRREIRANLLAIATAKAAEPEPVPQAVEHEADEEDMEIDPSSHSSKSGNTVDMRSVLSLSRESSVAPMSVVEGGIRSRRNTTSSVELASVDLSDEKSASMDSASVTEPIGENNRENDVDLEAERDADATLYGIEEPETDESASDSGSSKSNSKTGETTEDIGNVTQTPDNIITTTAGTEDSPPEPTAPIPYSTKDNPDTDKTASESCMSVSSATKTASEGSELLSETTESTTETSEHTSETTGSTTETSEYTSSTTQYTSGRSTEAVYEASSRGSFGDTESQTGDDQEKRDSGSEWELTLPIDPDDGSADSSRLTPDGDLIDVVVERFKDAAIQNRKKGSPKRKACREEDEYPNDRSEDFPSPRKKRNSGTPPRPSTPCSPRSIRTPRRRSNSEPSVAGGAERSEELVFLRRSSPRVSGKRPYLKRSAPAPE